MTLDERRMCMAYADLILVDSLIQHVLRIGAFELLSEGRKRDLASAETALVGVKEEVGRYMSEHTAFDSDIPKYANGTERKAEQDV